MDNIQKRYGYTGQGLRVNLTTGKSPKNRRSRDFKDEIGGTALGYRVFWDEVPPKTQPLDEANKLVIAPGPSRIRASARAVLPLRPFIRQSIRCR